MIWAFNKPSDEYVDFVSNSVKEGVSRFGWSWFDGANLDLLKNKEWDDMNKDEKEVWSRSGFLLDIKEGDWIVHINVPQWGWCTAAKVVGRYYFDKENKDKDFRHCIPVDKTSVIEFDRNDPNIHPLISRKLKLRGSYWRIRHEKEFKESIDNLKEQNINVRNGFKGIFYLKKELRSTLKEITNLIHKTHDGKNLEIFMAKVFEKVPTVEKVVENGFGFGTDYGADLIIEYNAGLPISGLERIEKLVVQIKSYEGEHWETNAVDQIKKAIEQYDANAGLIITTAEKTERLQKAIEDLSTSIKKPIALLSGNDVGKFVLKYYSDELIG